MDRRGDLHGGRTRRRDSAAGSDSYQSRSQGYLIKSMGNGGNHKLLLAGSDMRGTLYAAVTCRELIIEQDRATADPTGGRAGLAGLQDPLYRRTVL